MKESREMKSRTPDFRCPNKPIFWNASKFCRIALNKFEELDSCTSQLVCQIYLGLVLEAFDGHILKLNLPFVQPSKRSNSNRRYNINC